jgi:hypothetical protein
VERQAPAEHLADDRNLPRVTQGRRAREDVVSAGERRFGERAHRHGGDVALVDRRRLDRAVRPSGHVARANLRRPPVERVRPSCSMSAWSAAMGLGCRKNGCGVWCGDDRKTTRWTLRARRATTAETVAGLAAQTRNTASTPTSAGANESGSVRSPTTTSTPGGNGIGGGRRTRAPTERPRRRSPVTTARPTRPAAKTESSTTLAGSSKVCPVPSGSAPPGGSVSFSLPDRPDFTTTLTRHYHRSASGTPFTEISSVSIETCMIRAIELQSAFIAIFAVPAIGADADTVPARRSAACQPR